MYIFDTNILSEIMKTAPHPAVAAWLMQCPSGQMYTTTISRTEILYGIECLPPGGKRRILQSAARAMFAEDFRNRVFSFDEEAADACAVIRAKRRKAGRPISSEDAMIASIARIYTMCVVTRDNKGFDECGVSVINPWDTATG